MNITLSADHVYHVAGIEKPGVTQILDYNGLIPEFSKNDWAAERGLAIHAGSALLFQDILDWNSVDERITGFLRSLEKLIQLTGCRAINVEQKGYNTVADYCGQWDVLTKLFPGDKDDWTLDLKSGGPAKWHRLQTAAYQAMSKTKRRGGLYLREDGELPKLVEHTDPNDWRAFASALKIYHGEKALEKERTNLKAWMEEK